MIFLINEYVKPSTYENDNIQNKIKKSLAIIFDHHIHQGSNLSSEGDRLSLMTYGKNVRKMFNLVNIKKNKT
jgi:hypothetical protein